MKVYAEVSTRGIVDVICTKCKKSTKHASGGCEYATLENKWGYGSPKDGEHHQIHLCEACYDALLIAFSLTPEVTDYPLLG